MNFNVDEIMALSGSSVLYKMAINKPNGLILEDMDTGKRRFYSSRKYQFTPLGSIAIYTVTDSTPIADVFEKMKMMAVDTEAPKHKADGNIIEEYFAEVLPDYDPDQVSTSDMRKVIKWFKFLDGQDFFNRESTDDSEE